MFRKSSKEEQKEILENRAIRFLRKTNSLKETNPRLAYRFLRQAEKIYDGSLNSYSKEIDREFNRIFISFIKMYPPTIKVNSNLI